MSATEVHPLLDEAAIRAEGEPAAAAGGPALTAEEVATIVPARVPVPPEPLAYRAALGAVALTGTLLALVYLGLVAAAAWGLYAHLRFSSIRWGDAKDGFRLRDYAGLAVLLLVLLVLMVRPLFVRRRGERPGLPLGPGEEPVLHAFVERVARAVGAPVPARIDVDTEANASASFRRGYRSFLGGDLVLTLGAPLLAGMTVEQFASVLAHELGHFRQGAGMRLTYVADTLEEWFERVATHDGRLDAWVAKAGWFLGPIALWTWLLRKLFQGMHWTLVRAARLASRRMELDADDHALALVGGPATVAADRRLVLLGSARARALASCSPFLERRRYPEDLASLTLAWRARLAPEAAHAILDAVLANRTDAVATHPCVRERVERAQRVPQGPLRCDRSASALLADPPALFRRASDRLFSLATDGASEGAPRVTAADVLAAADRDAHDAEAFGRWSQGTVTYLALPRVRPALAEPLPSREEAVAELRDLRERLVAAAPAVPGAVEVLDQADTALIEALQIEAVLAVHGSPKEIPDLERIRTPTPEAVAAGRAAALSEEQTALATLDPVRELFTRRVRAGLALVAGTVSGGELRRRVERLAALEDVFDDVTAFRRSLASPSGVVREKSERRNARADPWLAAWAQAACEKMARIRAALAAAYDAEEAARIAPEPSDATDVVAVLEAAPAAARGYFAAWFGECRALAGGLEEAEEEAGLEPLPERDEE